MEVLDPIPIDLEPKAVEEELRVRNAGAWGPFKTAVEIVRDSIHARAAFEIHYVDARSDDEVVIDGIRFGSRVLSINLQHVGRVFPYVVTIGAVLEERIDEAKDLLAKYYLDAIGNLALIQARTYLEKVLRSKFFLNGLSFMSPGSLEDWPIEEQRSLFLLLEGIEHTMGVRLTENCLMIPKKSVSGVYFPSETTFYNCQLCPRSNCVGRKAAYSEGLAREYGIQKKEGRA
jgi:hypothetical protein